MPQHDSPHLSCFISAPPNFELTALRHALESISVDWEWAKYTQDAPVSNQLSTYFRRVIKNVDFVIGVLVGGTRDANTYLELGIAIGLNKPIFLIIVDNGSKHSFDDFPFNLLTTPNISAPISDEKSIKIRLSLFIESEKKLHKISSNRISKEHVLPNNLNRYLQTSNSSHEAHQYLNSLHSQYETEVIRLIQEAGGSVISAPDIRNSETHYRPDLLVWLSGDESEFFNPGVIEIKNKILDQHSLRKAENNLLHFINLAGLQTGLIIVPELPNKEYAKSEAYNIFVIDFLSFRALLNSSKLTEYLRQTRNRAVHGMR